MLSIPTTSTGSELVKQRQGGQGDASSQGDTYLRQCSLFFF